MMPGSSLDASKISPILVIDSWPVMEWLKKREPVTSRFRNLLGLGQARAVTLVMSTINLGEVYYNSAGEWGESRAEAIYAESLKLPIHFIHPVEEDVLAAARIKARYQCAYGDAFPAVLAMEFDCPLVTGDKDFLKIERGGMIHVDWWGK